MVIQARCLSDLASTVNLLTGLAAPATKPKRHQLLLSGICGFFWGWRMAALLFLSGAFWLLLLLEPTLAGAEDIIRPPGIPGIGYLAYGDSGADGHNDADVNCHPGSDPGWILIDSTWWLPATDKIVTQNAQGIYCEIFGGNGGNGGYNHLMNASGGNGGDGGGGGALFITNYGGIATSGIPGQGIYGRSYGGAGGNAGTGYGYPGIGGNGGAGGNGGPVTIDNQGAITTNGGQAHGIFAVSQAGGGGSGGYGHWGTGIGGNGGNGGNAGPVTIANQGAITTNGEIGRAHV